MEQIKVGTIVQFKSANNMPELIGSGLAADQPMAAVITKVEEPKVEGKDQIVTLKVFGPVRDFAIRGAKEGDDPGQWRKVEDVKSAKSKKEKSKEESDKEKKEPEK